MTNLKMKALPCLKVLNQYESNTVFALPIQVLTCLFCILLIVNTILRYLNFQPAAVLCSLIVAYTELGFWRNIMLLLFNANF